MAAVDGRSPVMSAAFAPLSDSGRADGKEQTVELAAIEERLEGLSAMPEDLVTHLTPRELRDLVEFMAAQRTAADGPAPAGGHGEAEE